MAKMFKQVIQMSLGLALVALAAQSAEAGTKPCPSCGSGGRPTTGQSRPTLNFPLPGGGSFTLPGRGTCVGCNTSAVRSVPSSGSSSTPSAGVAPRANSSISRPVIGTRIVRSRTAALRN